MFRNDAAVAFRALGELGCHRDDVLEPAAVARLIAEQTGWDTGRVQTALDVLERQGKIVRIGG